MFEMTFYRPSNLDSVTLNLNMKTGHGGVSGRYNFLKELAEEYSFLMFLENIKK